MHLSVNGARIKGKKTTTLLPHIQSLENSNQMQYDDNFIEFQTPSLTIIDLMSEEGIQDGQEFVKFVY